MPTCHSYTVVTEYCDEVIVIDSCLFFAKNRLKELYQLTVLYDSSPSSCPSTPPCSGYWYYLQTKSGEIFKLHDNSPLASNVIKKWNNRYNLSGNLESWIHKIKKVVPVNQIPPIECNNYNNYDNDKLIRNC